MTRRWGTGTVAREGDGWIARLPNALGRDRVGGVHGSKRAAERTLAAVLVLRRGHELAELALEAAAALDARAHGAEEEESHG